jgi:hypothetical protein
MQPDEWRSGDIHRLVELVADPPTQQALLKHLVEMVFKGRGSKCEPVTPSRHASLIAPKSVFQIYDCADDRRLFEQALTLTTKYKPQLDYTGFDWNKDVANFVQKLLPVERAILEKARFTGNSGCIYFTSPKGFITAQTVFMNDIAGALALAAAVQMDAGFKAANKIVATLSAMAKNPGIVKTRSVEPEAMGLIAANYQRGAEPRGTYWFDVYQDDNAQEPDLAQISRAAERAIIELRADVHSGRPESLVLAILATRLSELFLRYNDVATRHSVASDGTLHRWRLVPFSIF